MPTDNIYRIAVCDDESKDNEHIARITEKILQSEGVLYKITTYDNGKDLLESVRGGEKFNLMLLDVLMTEMDGMVLAAALRENNCKTAIVFISVSREMALKGYEVSAVRYLAKPLSEEKLSEALLYCHKVWQDKKEILLHTNNGQQKVSFADIQFVEAFDRGTKFVLQNETVDTKLKYVEAQTLLPKSIFNCCHRAFIVNFQCVKRMYNDRFEMKSGATVPISKHRYRNVSNEFFEYISG